MNRATALDFGGLAPEEAAEAIRAELDASPNAWSRVYAACASKTWALLIERDPAVDEWQALFFALGEMVAADDPALAERLFALDDQLQQSADRAAQMVKLGLALGDDALQLRSRYRVHVIPANKQKRTQIINRIAVRPKVPAKRKGRRGTRRAWKRAHPPRLHLIYEEPADVLVIQGHIIIATERQSQLLEKRWLEGGNGEVSPDMHRRYNPASETEDA